MVKKIVFNILYGFIAAIITILALVFIYIEGRLLFSGEWLVYDNVILGFFKCFFRLILALFSLSYSVTTFVNIKKQSATLSHYLFIGNISLLIMSIFLIFTASNMVGEIALIISLFNFLSRLVEMIIIFLISKKNRE